MQWLSHEHIGHKPNIKLEAVFALEPRLLWSCLFLSSPATTHTKVPYVSPTGTLTLDSLKSFFRKAWARVGLPP